MTTAAPAFIAGFIIRAVRWAWVRRNAGDTVPRAARTVVWAVIATACAVVAGYYAAGAVFTRIFFSFDNHDTAAPVLLAVTVALAVFLLVAAAVFSFLAWIPGEIRRSGSRPSPDDPSRCSAPGIRQSCPGEPDGLAEVE